jgi:hypothetical protein
MAMRPLWFRISVLAPLLSLVACIAPASTTTPTLALTPAVMSTPTPTSALRPPPVTVDLSSKTDGQGVLLETVRITSSDGRMTSTLPRGSKLLDIQGQPVKSLTLTPYRPAAIPDGVIVGLAYKWDDSVTWGTISPNGAVTVGYDPPPANPRLNLDNPTIGVWWNEKGLWAERSLPATIDPVAHTLTGAEGRFHDIAIIYWYTDVTHTVIVPPATPTPQAG